MSTRTPARALRRTGATCLVLALAFLGAAPASASSTPEPTSTPESTSTELSVAADLSNPAAAAADWLVSQLTDGDHFGTVVDGVEYADQGLTADGVFALAAADEHPDTLDAMVDYLVTTKDDYTGASFDQVYAGSLAKLALVLEVAGRDAHDAAGQDLLADLMAQMQTSGADAGRFSDTAADFDEDGTPDDYSNTITQSLAITALARAGDPVPDAAVSFLIGEQCDDGGFPSLFPVGGAACSSDPDATGFAITALAAAGGTGAAGDAGTAAVSWLRSDRLANGSWPADSPVNATAVAGSGLLLVGDDVSASMDYLGSVQLDDGSLPITAGDTTGDARATTQSVLLLAGESLLSVGAGGIDRVTFVPTPGGTASPTAAPTSTVPATTAPTTPTTEPTTEPTTTGTTTPPSTTSSASTSASFSTSTSASTSPASAGVGAARGDLPRTGVEATTGLTLAALLVLAGTGLVLASRTRVRGRHR